MQQGYWKCKKCGAICMSKDPQTRSIFRQGKHKEADIVSWFTSICEDGEDIVLRVKKSVLDHDDYQRNQIMFSHYAEIAYLNLCDCEWEPTEKPEELEV